MEKDGIYLIDKRVFGIDETKFQKARTLKRREEESNLFIHNLYKLKVSTKTADTFQQTN